MGADIHTFIEHKNKETGKWEEVMLYKKEGNEFKRCWQMLDSRHYARFAKLAGVRGYQPESFPPPRGLPDDLSDTVKEEYGTGEWYHSSTWFDVVELRLLSKLEDAYEENYEYDEGKEDYVVSNRWNVLSGWLDRIEMILDAHNVWASECGVCRVICWFDS